MSATRSAAESIAIIRELIGLIPVKTTACGIAMHRAVFDLQRQAKNIAKNASLVDETLLLAEQIAAFRGRGNQQAAREISRLFGYLIHEVVERPPISGSTFDSFAEARTTVLSEGASWNLLEKLAARAIVCVQGQRSRSLHTSDLRVEGWRQLGSISEVVRDFKWLELAQKVSGDRRAPSDERQAAFELMKEFWYSELPDAATTAMLRELENEPPTRTFLVTVMQAQIDLGLSNEFAALDAVGKWDDANSNH